jgi:acyl-CoA synthetase (AMP-forming)/AMP-acid ligase II
MTAAHHGNVSFALLDTAVIRGRGDEPVVDRMSHARLLEEAAALGGVLRQLGVRPGTPIVIDLDEDLDAVIAALASARIGGVVTTVDDPEAPAVVVSDGSAVPGHGRVRLVRGDHVAEPDLEWDAMIRAGRTDPAGAEELPAGSAYSRERSTEEQIAVLISSKPPYAAAELRRLLQV